MSSTFTSWNGTTSLDRYVRACIEGRDSSGLREEAYRDGATWGEIDLALFEARLRIERERTDDLVLFVDSMIDASFAARLPAPPRVPRDEALTVRPGVGS